VCVCVRVYERERECVCVCMFYTKCVLDSLVSFVRFFCWEFSFVDRSLFICLSTFWHMWRIAACIGFWTLTCEKKPNYKWDPCAKEMHRRNPRTQDIRFDLCDVSQHASDFEFWTNSSAAHNNNNNNNKNNSITPPGWRGNGEIPPQSAV